MKTVCKINQCTGCNACVDSCAHNAITLQDNLLSFNAVIDEKKCVSCNLCEQRCPNNNWVEFVHPIACYEGWAKESTVRSNATSGGIASAIILKFIRDGGEAYSCRFYKGEFVFSKIDINEMQYFTGSKYVKSSPRDVFKSVLKTLNTGTKVLFIGLPCQVAGCKNFVKASKNFQNLYTVDLICHGSPSPQLLYSYLNGQGIDIAELDNIKFRDKTSCRIDCVSKGKRDYYTMAFMAGLMYTENCYSCLYARPERVSDLTIGDSWGSRQEESQQMKGISLMICSTSKGEELINIDELEKSEYPYQMAVATNAQLKQPAVLHRNRNKFFKKFYKKGFEKAAKDCLMVDMIKKKLTRMIKRK